MFCPYCGNEHINSLPNNSPVADFACPLCKQEYELKSKSGKLSSKITDGAYNTMITRITSNTNPHLFVMEYSMSTLCIKNLILIPNYFFVPDIIEQRKALAPTAKRAGWIGCNILINKVPSQGKIHIIYDGQRINKNTIIKKAKIIQTLEIGDIQSRGWLIDTLRCIENISKNEFSLNDVYQYEHLLHTKYPDNQHIQAKIRQQLQLLRDKGYIEFLGNGNYKKLV